MALILSIEVTIIGHEIYIMITCGEEVGMIYHEIGDEQTIERLDSDHVIHDTMYLVSWSGMLYYNILHCVMVGIYRNEIEVFIILIVELRRKSFRMI